MSLQDEIREGNNMRKTIVSCSITSSGTSDVLKRFLVCVLSLMLAGSAVGMACAESGSALQLFGTVTGDVYENDYLGIGCKLDGWHYYSEEEIAEANQLARSTIASADIVDLLENADILFLMMAESPITFDNVNIVLQYMDETNLGIINTLGIDVYLRMSFEEYFKSMLEQAGYQVINTKVINTNIGGIDYPGLEISYINNGIHLQVKQIYSLYGNYMMALTVTAQSQDTVDNILSNFYVLENKRTGSTPLMDHYQEQQALTDETSDSTYYHDQEVGINFIIPSGWEEKPLSAERELVKMKMSPMKDDAVTIMYGWGDLWGGISSADKSAMGISSREDLDSWIDAELVAYMFGVDAKDVETRTISGLQYGICTISTNSAFTTDSTVAITIKNGYLIMFQLYDIYGHYQDIFDAVLESVNFNE